ncbi:hypothetical protein BU24DRAFT_489170 [Aaosphaeria arxii CBS 175.79]|uniref:Uncharacterized protein n=1 Tax=Aaosphaeria arxii CBS 175.79 TaxID=1450172 RepID=A0A6A5Y3L2_9PLEO|nr:uncharacterized protein BU24DRAFT_489170 [Aaosphaeria arxii CBS 175.79]KAF2019144.1 hypothetical protein BU24DRAFT_489170 [Aaosphaeria arxii CBS 175.79]
MTIDPEAVDKLISDCPKHLTRGRHFNILGLERDNKVGPITFNKYPPTEELRKTMNKEADATQEEIGDNMAAFKEKMRCPEFQQQFFKRVLDQHGERVWGDSRGHLYSDTTNPFYPKHIRYRNRDEETQHSLELGLLSWIIHRYYRLNAPNAENSRGTTMRGLDLKRTSFTTDIPRENNTGAYVAPPALMYEGATTDYTTARSTEAIFRLPPDPALQGEKRDHIQSTADEEGSNAAVDGQISLACRSTTRYQSPKRKNMSTGIGPSKIVKLNIGKGRVLPSSSRSVRPAPTATVEEVEPSVEHGDWPTSGGGIIDPPRTNHFTGSPSPQVGESIHDQDDYQQIWDQTMVDDASFIGPVPAPEWTYHRRSIDGPPEDSVLPVLGTNTVPTALPLNQQENDCYGHCDSASTSRQGSMQVIDKDVKDRALHFAEQLLAYIDPKSGLIEECRELFTELVKLWNDDEQRLMLKFGSQFTKYQEAVCLWPEMLQKVSKYLTDIDFDGAPGAEWDEHCDALSQEGKIEVARAYHELKTWIHKNYKSGPVSVDTLARALHELLGIFAILSPADLAERLRKNNQKLLGWVKLLQRLYN